MEKSFLLIWLADQMKPHKIKNYLQTTRGLAPFNGELEKANSFLTKDQIKYKKCCYESLYDIYELDLEKINFKANVDKNITYSIEDIGDLKSIQNNGSFLDFLVFNKELFIFDLDGNYWPLINYIVDKVKATKIYSKKKLYNTCEVIRFYFKTNCELVGTNKENMDNGLIGDYKNIYDYCYGTYKFNPNKQLFPLLMWPRKEESGEYKELTELDYYEFVKLDQSISDRNFDFYDRFKYVKNHNGKFYSINNGKEIIGTVCASMGSSTYYFIDYVNIKDFEYFNKIILGLKKLAYEQNKNLVIVCEDPTLRNLYNHLGFKPIGYWNFEEAF